MKRISCIIVNILLIHLGFGQNRLTGRVLYHNSGERPAKNVEVSALGANSVNTTSNGLFILNFANKKHGDQIKLMIGDTDGNGKSIVVVNDKQLEVLRLPSSTDETLVEVFVTFPNQRTAAVRQFYGILEKVTLSEFDRKINEIKKELQQSNLSSKKTATLIAQTDELRRERDEALAKIEEQAAFIASINKDRASELVKNAIEKIEKGEDIDEALELLNNDNLDKAYQAALAKKNEGESEIKQTIQGYELKISLLLPKFKYAEAIVCYEAIIEIHKANQFKEEDLAYWYRKAAGVYRDAGNYKKALTYDHEGRTIQEKLLNPKHPDLALSYNNIASDHYFLGAYKKALYYSQRAISIREEILDHKHIDLAASYNNTSIYYSRLGEYKKALEYGLKAIAIREEILDPKHPDLAISYNNIAFNYQDLGQYESALKYQQKSLSIREEILDPKHLSLSTAYNNIAMIYRDLKKYKMALEYHEKAVGIREEILIPKHPYLANAYSNTGITYQVSGQYGNALKYFKKTLDIREEILDLKHPYLASSYGNLGNTYRALGQYENALKYQQKAITINEEILDSKHPSLGLSYTHIAVTYTKIKAFQKAIEFQKKCMTIFKEALPANHPYRKKAPARLAWIYNSKGLNAYNKKDYIDAIKAYHKAMIVLPGIKAKYFYNNIGLAYAKNKQFKEAHDAFLAYEKLFPNKGKTFRNWVMYYALQNEREKALSNLQKAIALGYNDLEWLRTDDSMDNLRDEKVFVEILKTLKK